MDDHRPRVLGHMALVYGIVAAIDWVVIFILYFFRKHITSGDIWNGSVVIPGSFVLVFLLSKLPLCSGLPEPEPNYSPCSPEAKPGRRPPSLSKSSSEAPRR